MLSETLQVLLLGTLPTPQQATRLVLRLAMRKALLLAMRKVLHLLPRLAAYSVKKIPMKQSSPLHRPTQSPITVSRLESMPESTQILFVPYLLPITALFP